MNLGVFFSFVCGNEVTSSQNRCPPASPELAMAGRRRVPCIISYAGVSSDETFLKTIPIETGFWRDSVLFCKSIIRDVDAERTQLIKRV